METGYLARGGSARDSASSHEQRIGGALGMLISAMVNGHREGRLLSAALRSVRKARDVAGLSDAEMEVLLVLDRPDEVTLEVAARCAELITSMVVVDFGDAGLARNAGVNETKGRAIATLDADDVWGSQWLNKGLAYASELDEPAVLHAQVAQYFDADQTGFQSPCMSDPKFRVVSVLGSNPWTSLVIADGDTFRAVPYRPTPPDHRFAYEDWAWNCDTIAAGYPHRIVPTTVHFVRRRSGSLSRRSLGQRALPIPHNLTLERALEIDSQTASTPNSDEGARSSAGV